MIILFFPELPILLSSLSIYCRLFSSLAPKITPFTILLYLARMFLTKFNHIQLLYLQPCTQQYIYMYVCTYVYIYVELKISSTNSKIRVSQLAKQAKAHLFPFFPLISTSYTRTHFKTTLEANNSHKLNPSKKNTLRIPHIGAGIPPESHLKLRQSSGTLILCSKLDLGCLSRMQKTAAGLTESSSMGSPAGVSTASSSASALSEPSRDSAAVSASSASLEPGTWF